MEMTVRSQCIAGISRDSISLILLTCAITPIIIIVLIFVSLIFAVVRLPVKNSKKLDFSELSHYIIVNNY